MARTSGSHASAVQRESRRRGAEAIVQDERGFMWFGTQYGGKSLMTATNSGRFVTSRGDARSLCGVYIRTLFKDREGRLWIGCELQLDRYEPATGDIHPLSVRNHSRHPGSLLPHVTIKRGGRTGCCGCELATAFTGSIPNPATPWGSIMIRPIRRASAAMT